MLQSLIIIGASGNAHDVLGIVDAINARKPTWNVVGFLDDRLKAGSDFLDLEILGPTKSASIFEDSQFINCIGSELNHHRRQQIVEALNLESSRFATLIHPDADVSVRTRVGCGVYVSYGCSIGGNVVLGDHVSLAPNVTIGHDSIIEDHSVLAPAAVVSGRVRVGAGCYLGAGCAVRQHLTIGTSALVGMGAVVTHNVEPRTAVAGVPAKLIARRRQREIFADENPLQTDIQGDSMSLDRDA